MMAQHQPNHIGGNPNYWCLYLKVFPCLAGESYIIYINNYKYIIYILFLSLNQLFLVSWLCPPVLLISVGRMHPRIG